MQVTGWEMVSSLRLRGGRAEARAAIDETYPQAVEYQSGEDLVFWVVKGQPDRLVGLAWWGSSSWYFCVLSPILFAIGTKLAIERQTPLRARIFIPSRWFEAALCGSEVRGSAVVQLRQDATVPPSQWLRTLQERDERIKEQERNIKEREEQRRQRDARRYERWVTRDRLRQARQEYHRRLDEQKEWLARYEKRKHERAEEQRLALEAERQARKREARKRKARSRRRRALRGIAYRHFTANDFDNLLNTDWEIPHQRAEEFIDALDFFNGEGCRQYQSKE